jgi:hypothetical protein
MAYYLVRSKPKCEDLSDLEQLLQQDAFVALRPFGKAITLALRNARIQEDGTVIWEEEDYCSPPLAQERTAVLDTYFEDITVEVVAQHEGWKRIHDLPALFPDLADPAV